MESPGPPYQGQALVSSDPYANRNYANHILSPSGVSTNYMTYHTDGSHPSNYSEQSHYSTTSPSPHSYNSSNSGQSYGQPVNQFNEMYDTCSPFAANIPGIRQPMPSSNLKYWTPDQMSHNSHNYNQQISPPPLMSRNHNLRSPPVHSSHCNAATNYNGTGVPHRPSSRSPQDWSAPSVMSPPRSTPTTPSPLNRSPSHMSSQQFSPTHTSQAVSEVSQPSAPKGQTGIAFNNQNHDSSPASASNPLQSLQKMVTPMPESDNTNIQTSYNGSVEMSSNAIQKNYNSDNAANNDPDSPYPTYYNLDQNRLCTPPHSNPNPNLNPQLSDIPNNTKDNYVSSGGQSLKTNDTELTIKKCEPNDSNDANSDLIYSNLDDSKPDIRQMSSPNSKDTSVGVNGDIPLKPANVSQASSEVSSDLSQEVLSEHMNPSLVSKRTESRDSVQSSDSETAHSAYSDSRAPHIWPIDKDYYNRYPDQKPNWSQWPQHNNVPHSPVPQSGTYLGPRPPVGSSMNCLPYQSSYSSSQCGSGSWAQPVSSNSSQQFTPPKNTVPDAGKKKRGRPFGSKNRKNSDDSNSGKNPPSAPTAPSHSKKSKKSLTEEIGINTSVSIDAHSFDELAVVNPLKQTAKRKKTIGPFVRMEKRKGGLTTSFEIVNASSKPEDEKDVKAKTHSTKAESLKHHIRRPSLVVSKKVMTTFDLNATDKTWVCALCHKGPHYKGLGDLFGPYYVPLDDKNNVPTHGSTPAPTTSNTRSHTSVMESINKTIDSVIASEQKVVKRGRKKKSETNDDCLKSRPKHNETESSGSHPPTNASEVWVHEDCLVWSNNVYLIGHRVKNLEEVISESTENVCTKCKLTGATLGCLQKSCNTSQFHYLCAKEKGCEMDEDNFSLYCPKHKKKTKCNPNDASVCSSSKS